jgi:CPA1 family monovalent cation:H+ antiporter
MKSVKVPKYLMSIIEGESLLNDASSLIVFRFALAAVITGQFHFQKAAMSFVLVIVMGILIGLAIGLIFYFIHRMLLNSPHIEIVLTLITPYCMYYAAETFHFSGVLAVVSGGLFLSNKRQSMLNYRSRIEGGNVWTNIVFVMNGLIFLLIGLQLPSIISQIGDIGLWKAIGYGLAISGVLIVTRFICTFGASVFTKIMSNFITVADPNPGYKGPLVLGWAGMRGVVSLAAALSIPILISEGNPFPHRNLILFITFIVILITLVLQGLTLPWLVRKVKLEDKHSKISEQNQELIIQKKLALYSSKYLEEKYGTEFVHNEVLHNLHSKFALDAKLLSQQLENISTANENQLRKYQSIYLELLEHQRKMLTEMNLKAEYDDDLIKKYLSLIDIEEFKLREKIFKEEDTIQPED